MLLEFESSSSRSSSSRRLSSEGDREKWRTREEGSQKRVRSSESSLNGNRVEAVEAGAGGVKYGVERASLEHSGNVQVGGT